MKFKPFIPEYDAARREAIGRRRTPETQEGKVLYRQVVVEEHFAQNRRPFYRLYPGVTEALTRLGIEKIDISMIRPPVNPLSLEFPEGRPLIAGSRKIVNILFMEFEYDDSLFIEYRSHVDTFGVSTFPRKYNVIESMLNNLATDSERETTRTVMQIVFGVCMIPQSDTSLILPRVLNCDSDKFEATGDPKYIERAKQRGVVGWDVGRDLPTAEEMETLREQHGVPGRKSPHWRNDHVAIRYTGQGRTIPVLTRIKGALVNKDLLKEIPHGYHGKETADDS